MANEITINASLSYEDSTGVEKSLSVSDIVKTSTSKIVLEHIQTIGTSEEAIALGDTSGALGYAMFRNLDPTNFISIKTATSGTIFARLDADTNADGKGGVALFKFGSGVTAPFAVADTAACRMEILIIST